MNKTCFLLIAVVVAMNPAFLFAGETMVTQTNRPPTRCDFRVDNCETTVATDPAYAHFKDGTVTSSVEIGSATGDPGFYRSSTAFQDYPSPPKTLSVEELLALIRSKLSNCPEVEFTYDNDTGDITLRYLNSPCECEWIVNIRDVKANDFVWKRTSDNYSPRLGQLERKKFHTTSEKDAQDIESALAQICAINGWTISKD